MAQTITIRPFQLTSAHAFAKLRKDIERESDSMLLKRGERKENAFHVIAKTLLSQRRTVTFIAYDGHAMIGYLSMVFPRYRRLSGNAYITLGVRETYRGQGIGTNLMHEAERYARTREARRIELEVFGTNTRARTLYERHGYVTEGVKKNAVTHNDGFDDMIIMAKYLVS